MGSGWMGKCADWLVTREILRIFGGKSLNSSNSHRSNSIFLRFSSGKIWISLIVTRGSGKLAGPPSRTSPDRVIQANFAIYIIFKLNIPAGVRWTMAGWREGARLGHWVIDLTSWDETFGTNDRNLQCFIQISNCRVNLERFYGEK